MLAMDTVQSFRHNGLLLIDQISCAMGQADGFYGSGKDDGEQRNPSAPKMALGPTDLASSTAAMFRWWPVSGAGNTAIDRPRGDKRECWNKVPAKMIGVGNELLAMASPTCP